MVDSTAFSDEIRLLRWVSPVFCFSCLVTARLVENLFHLDSPTIVFLVERCTSFFSGMIGGGSNR